MICAEFEERTYEAPLYHQLESGHIDIFTPGQVLEKTVGFDFGLFTTQSAVWKTLGFKSPLNGIALGYYNWSAFWGPINPNERLPRFRLNLFVQVKRPTYYNRRPRSLRSFEHFRGPLWSFRVTPHQQRLLEFLCTKSAQRAHVTYAAPAFHTNSALFAYMRAGTLIEHSTFPSVQALASHDAWYYRQPGTWGIANPKPESIEEPSLFDRLRRQESQSVSYEPGDLTWLDQTAHDVIDGIDSLEGIAPESAAYFLDDLRILNGLIGRASPPEYRSYAQILLFTIRFGLAWLIVAD